MPHINKAKILKLDIKDFFGSITSKMVYSYVFNSKSFSKSAGILLANLCCIDGCLPQGAPTSPAISNIVMKGFDDYISNWCQDRKIGYTRYCDDMTFSGDFDENSVINKVSAFLSKMGFALNISKTKVIPYYRKQIITEIVANKKLSISREYLRQLRKEIYYCKKFGVESHIRHTNNQQYIKGKKVLINKYVQHLNGKINFVLHIQSESKETKAYRDYIKSII